MPAIETIHKLSSGRMAVRQSEGQGAALLMLHGNSSSKEAFSRQIDGPLGKVYRIIAPDLPGHGRSDDAVDPFATYSMTGYVDGLLELLGKLGIERAVVFGWSLGGHIGIEMLARWRGIAGLMISAAPPIPPTMEGIQAGFMPHPLAMLAGQQELTAAEASAFLEVTLGKPVPAFAVAAMQRADGRARRMMFEKLFAGAISDQRRLVETSPVPVALVDGADEPFSNLDYVVSLAVPKLWNGRAMRIPGAGHSAFWQAPEAFNATLLSFMRDVAREAPQVKAARVRGPELVPSRRRRG
jgi:pimeloyl-ACP methyl ester carboxylesterase